MSDRIEQQRYQNAIYIKDLLKKKAEATRRADGFAQRLKVTQDPEPSRVPKEKIPQKSQPCDAEDPKPQKSLKKANHAPKEERREKKASKKDSDSFLELAAQFATQKEKAPEPATPSAALTLPQSVLNEIIEHIRATSDAEGQKSIMIDLKSHVLSGAQIIVSVSERKVRLRFQGTNTDTKQLLRNSKHLIQSRLAQKKLALLDFACH